MPKFPGQGSNPSHSRDNCRSLTHWATRGLTLLTWNHWGLKLTFSFFFLSFFFFFCLLSFKGHTHSIWRFPSWGSNWSCWCWPKPEPQQYEIWATSATYATAHGNTRSSTHRARPGIEPATSWFLVGFVATEPWRERLFLAFFKKRKNDSVLGSWSICLPDY